MLETSARRGPFVVASLFSLAACGGSGVQGPPVPGVPNDAINIPYVQIANIQNSGLRQPARNVVRDQATWEGLWSQITRGVSPRRGPPAVPFASEVVIVAALGQRATGGHRISIDGIYETTDRIYVIVRETAPGTGCVVSQGFTAPVVAVAVQRVNKPVSFETRRDVDVCG